jgi:hypothetical protein
MEPIKQEDGYDEGIGYYPDLHITHIPNYLAEIKDGKSTPQEIANDLATDFGQNWKQIASKLINDDWNNYTWNNYSQSEMQELLKKVLA